MLGSKIQPIEIQPIQIQPIQIQPIQIQPIKNEKNKNEKNKNSDSIKPEDPLEHPETIGDTQFLPQTEGSNFKSKMSITEANTPQ